MGADARKAARHDIGRRRRAAAIGAKNLGNRLGHALSPVAQRTGPADRVRAFTPKVRH